MKSILTFIIFTVLATSAFADDVEDILNLNAGIVTGKTVEVTGACEVHVYRPGEFGGDKGFWVEHSYDFSPAIFLAPYPNNGFIYSWDNDVLNGKLTYYVNEKKSEFTTIYFDLATKKFKKLEHTEQGSYKTSCAL